MQESGDTSGRPNTSCDWKPHVPYFCLNLETSGCSEGDTNDAAEGKLLQSSAHVTLPSTEKESRPTNLEGAEGTSASNKCKNDDLPQWQGKREYMDIDPPIVYGCYKCPKSYIFR